mgnify:CR=1 FL=1
MKIIDNNLAPYQIHRDGANYSVVEPTGDVDKNGNGVFKNRAFCSSVEGALKRIIKLKIEAEDTLTLKSYLDRYEKLSDSILKVRA